jgi:nicotinamide-nucleotide amidase
MILKSIRFIRDDIEEINKALTDSLAESDVVITSGGIGPTIDDKTKTTLANYFGKKIIERDDVADIVTKNYIRFGRTWQPGHNYYHFFPEDFIAVPNPRGLAPGIAYYQEVESKLVMAGPGVPREFTEMVDKEFFPLIKNFFGNRLAEFFQTVIRTSGVSEEKIFFELCPTLWRNLEHFGKVSSLPHTIGIDIVVSYTADEKEHLSKNAAIKKLIESTPLSSHVWQYGNIPVHELVFAKAKEMNATFSIAESCTGGLTSSKITDLSGASEVYKGGVVSYANLAKRDLLGVNEKSLQEFGAVSLEVAKEMAEGAMKKFKTNFAISLTGITGPTGGSPEKPEGTIVIGYAGAGISGAQQFLFPGDRIRRKERFSDQALLMLLHLMEGKLN